MHRNLSDNLSDINPGFYTIGLGVRYLVTQKSLRNHPETFNILGVYSRITKLIPIIYCLNKERMSVAIRL